MSRDFRIMPKQTKPEVGVFYGVLIPDHPKGRYVAGWATWLEAKAAAYALGMDPHTEVHSWATLKPEKEVL